MKVKIRDYNANLKNMRPVTKCPHPPPENKKNKYRNNLGCGQMFASKNSSHCKFFRLFYQRPIYMFEFKFSIKFSMFFFYTIR
jgi:hypothetical protein